MGFLTDLIGGFLARGEVKNIQQSLAENGEYQQAKKDFEKSYAEMDKIIRSQAKAVGLKLNYGENESEDKEWDF